MRIIGLMVVGPGEADKYLKQALDDFKRLKVDDAVIVGNNTGEEEEALIESYGYVFYRDDREWGVYQPKIKTDALKKCGRIGADWILAKDADELFDHRLTRDNLERLAERGGIAWYFYVVNLWDAPDRYAQGLSFWNVRFYKYAPEFGLDFISKPVHCGLAPPIAYRFGNYSPYILWHYGLMAPEARAKKVERYKKYDPNAQYKSDIYYEALKWKGKGAKLDTGNLRRKVAQEVESYKVKGEPAQENKVEGYSYVTRDGRTIDVPSKDVARYERQGWKFLSKIEVVKDDAPEAPVETKPKKRRRGFKKVE